MKHCGRCDEDKPEAEFNRCRSRPDGLQCRCRACQRSARAANPERALAKERAYEAANREARAARKKAYREANPGSAAAESKAYRKANRELILARSRAYEEAHPGRGKARRDADLEKDRARHQAYQKANPDKIRANTERYRARKQGSSASKVDYTALYVAHQGICGICGLATGPDYHMDHIVPLARGGSHTEDNLQPAHPRCNQSKGSKLMSELNP